LKTQSIASSGLLDEPVPREEEEGEEEEEEFYKNWRGYIQGSLEFPT